MVLVLWRRGAAVLCEGARGAPAVRAGRRVRRAAAAKCQTPLQRRRRQQPAARRINEARGSLFVEGATASGLGQRCFLILVLTSCFVLWATNACCALALSGLDLSNPTSLLFDFGRAFCFSWSGDASPRSRRRSTRSHPPAQPWAAPRCEQPVTGPKRGRRKPGLRKGGDKDQGAARTAAQRRCGPSSPSPRS